MSRISPHWLAQGARALLLGGSLLAISSSARADQFTLVELAWTDTKDQAANSHYYVDPSAATPKNLKSPVDYSKGSMHIVLDVKTKPSAAQTRFQVCFEQGAAAECADASPVYTKTGQVEWTSQVANWWIGTAIDWSKPIGRVALILKDNNYVLAGTAGVKVEDYYPTNLHVAVTMLSAGATYTPPTSAPSDAGTTPHVDAGTAHDASAPTTEDDDASVVTTPPVESTSHDAATTAMLKDAGSQASARTDAAAGAAGGGDAALDGGKTDDGCNAGGRRTDGTGIGWLIALAIIMRGWGRRRRWR